MIAEYYLVFTYRGEYNNLGVRACSKAPNLRSNEIAISCRADLPATLFTKPKLQAELKIPEGSVQPQVIDIETIDNIQEAIKQHCGIDICLSIEPQEDEG